MSRIYFSSPSVTPVWSNETTNGASVKSIKSVVLAEPLAKKHLPSK